MKDAGETDEFDVIVIGGGAVGENAAQYAIAGGDLSAVIIEHELLGGECSYWACMPSKVLLTPSDVLTHAEHVPGVASRLTGDRVDVEATLARRDKFTHGLDDSSQVDWAVKEGIAIIRGHGRLSGAREVTVGGRTIRARRAVVLATGSTASIAPIDGLDAALPWTSRDATNVHEVPQRLAIIGGGVVACEAATWFASFGTQVTLLVRDDRLLRNVSEFAATAVLDGLRSAGVTVELNTSPASITRVAPKDTGYGRIHGGPVSISSSRDGEAGHVLEVDEVLAATGRAPGTEDLGLDTVGLSDLSSSHGFIPVDDSMRVVGVEGDWLFAVGDVNGRALLTHQGKYQARVCGDVIAATARGEALEGPRYVAASDHDAVPQVIFTQPEVASVGRSESALREAGFDIRRIELPMAVAGTAVQRDDDPGTAELLLDKDTGVVLAATFAGPSASTQLYAATIAVSAGLTVEQLWQAVPAYPTPSEVWLRLCEAAR
ncbi:MAG: NAD(P)/FAD-dependent oxidoreductase [Ornithinimicrobium sp.]|uniref:dihydrolipoyl dehydrogenase family protein n=1 Tax=Ornithinimicrobium sp. TaxID=1977084 RepID=UPI0026E00E99|nr:NAD(P)/FAD-dependent oxidoreductase [Ornithinimicrobium sp.]MDO5740197.1 NAD(P)/FAD-dependent oxidoreductase [Ornithinimicrobium sp.]